MGIFNKKKKEEKPAATEEVKIAPAEATVAPVSKSEKKVSKKSEAKSDKTAVKGGTNQAYRILVKPLVTEKATQLGALNKYVFEVDPSMNKVEVKKAIRSIYSVEPLDVNISNFSGKNVRFGRIQGKRKGWKKAIITLKKGDSIEVYEGV